ncbi:hypothetical protein AB0H20_21995 [Nocardia fluminea]|uniref:hypothetical protein n=1 Tax=Nocardia fluminea TaxID=134984 RepID=UPI0033F48786
MRIFHGDEPADDNEHNHIHNKPQPPSEPDAARMAETLVDEAEAFLAGLALNNPHEPAPGPKPVARLVKSLTGEQGLPVPVEDENLIPALRPQPDQAGAPGGRRVPKWARTALPGSLVVVAVALAATYSQPAVVAVPIDIYAGAWVGFLFWNAAHRPPLRDITTAALTGALGLISAVIGLFAHGIRALVTGVGLRRERFETARTAH